MLLLKNLHQTVGVTLRLPNAILTSTTMAGFTTRSRKDAVPQILKDPKFTRKGIQKEKKKKYEHDLTQPHIANPHLYYNSKEDKRLERKERKLINKLEQENRDLNTVGLSEYENIIKYISDEENMTKPSSGILNKIIELEAKYPEKIDELKDLIGFSLKKLIYKVYAFNFREFGILVTLSARYLPNDKEAVDSLITYFVALLEKKEYQEINFLQQENYQKNFAFIFGNLVSKGNNLGIDIAPLIEKTQAFAKNKINDFKSISDLIIFVTSLTTHLKENSSIIKSLILKVEPSVTSLNFNDVSAIIQLLGKQKAADFSPLVQKLELRACEFLQKDSEIKLSNIAILIQSISNIPNHKVSEKIKAEFIRIHKTRGLELKKPIDICFFAEGLYRLGIINKEHYLTIEKSVIQTGFAALSLKNISQLVRCLGKSLENKFAFSFLENIAKRADEILKIKAKGYSNREAANIVSLFKFVKGKNKELKLESFEALKQETGSE